MRIIETEYREKEKPPYKTEEQVEDLCCESHPALPCKEVWGIWDRYSDEDVLKELGIFIDENGLDESGRPVEIRYKSRENPCGYLVTKFDLSGKSCCDEAIPLEYLEDESGDIVAPNSFVKIAVLGGLSDLTVSVRGSGFWLDSERTIRDATFIGNNNPLIPFYITVYTTAACGYCAVTVNDGCSSVEGDIKGTDGFWEQILGVPETTCLALGHGIWNNAPVTGYGIVSSLWHETGGYLFIMNYSGGSLQGYPTSNCVGCTKYAYQSCEPGEDYAHSQICTLCGPIDEYGVCDPVIVSETIQGCGTAPAPTYPTDCFSAVLLPPYGAYYKEANDIFKPSFQSTCTGDNQFTSFFNLSKGYRNKLWFKWSC